MNTIEREAFLAISAELALRRTMQENQNTLYFFKYENQLRLRVEPQTRIALAKLKADNEYRMLMGEEIGYRINL